MFYDIVVHGLMAIAGDDGESLVQTVIGGDGASIDGESSRLRCHETSGFKFECVIWRRQGSIWVLVQTCSFGLRYPCPAFSWVICFSCGVDLGDNRTCNGKISPRL
ncbi:hypothetical protein F0562_022358 [Nyssa sinensis]|uniref:Uncharacterized protein n=1 Tax=Nyssa sinensis TaxID=561372 RepID=A0A5J5BNZ1_9ASTE|nr:hypothetical protein F0562_022358 [Nyssa sinensis]